MMSLVSRYILSMVLVFVTAYAQGAEPDWTDYHAVLEHIRPGNKNGVSLMLVDYKTIRDNGSLDRAYEALSAFPVANLSGREEKLAFYINAYNILALKMVADHWPLKGIKDVGSWFSPVWKKPAGELDGKVVTLDEVEHEILRPMGEPRVHMAVVCASVSCPDLRGEPFVAARLDEQLNDQTTKFLNNVGKGLRVSKETIRVSKIFDWFEKDFSEQGGVEAFVRSYRSDLPDYRLKANIPYDWEVNAIR
ncbi:MAG: DUF547 domain-containing protein [Methylomicrobium sp.]|nr:DUF547 domain-containing protein [Methylomicrobium sp.]